MILEVAILQVKQEKQTAFEENYVKASSIISSMRGYVSHELKKCIEIEDQYILLVNWQTLEDHEIGFRQSQDYQEWKKLLHHFYDPFPKVLHYS
ncbi:antibiotic biosynthesis monooxygenase [Flagellimonas sp. CMM7]|uniref:antibiotic biosynthesis monooxygenase family protein n=1 Tax=Flagellimonas sp. CMM7 TaxID=2654676 RepID=UPI0013D6A99C|nr:antibiotic biosynthesis monooxygenase [Flagellimonas sp. CMM7]UII80753.1 antibiotic biosynthesis monooxygenase [Flagellimonas sp. CMM7]